MKHMMKLIKNRIVPISSSVFISSAHVQSFPPYTISSGKCDPGVYTV